MNECVVCNKVSKYHAKKMCSSCYHKDHYERNIISERIKRKISGKKYYSTPEGRYTFSKNRSNKQRNIKWDLTLEQYKQLISKKCYYCDNKLNPMGTGLDRLKSDVGYTIDNVVPCCGSCNKIKSDELTSEEMIFVIKQLKLFRGNK